MKREVRRPNLLSGRGSSISASRFSEEARWAVE